MPRPFIYGRLAPTLDVKILFCEVALLHLKQFIIVLPTRHLDTTRDNLLLLGVLFHIALLAPFESVHRLMVGHIADGYDPSTRSHD